MMRAVVVAVLLALSQAQNNFTCEVVDNYNSSFDYFMFVQESPVSYCRFNNCTGQGPKLWTIHGLWPTSLSEPVPNYCGGKEFNVSSLHDIMSDLLIDWPGLHHSSVQFWKHEWCRHGTCAGSVNSLDSEIKFFSTVLDLYKKHNIVDILQQYGIIPSHDCNRYEMYQFNDAFVQAIKVTPFLQCQQDQYTGIQILYQVTICFNKDLTPIPCTYNLYIKEHYTCIPEEHIYYCNSP